MHLLFLAFRNGNYYCTTCIIGDMLAACVAVLGMVFSWSSLSDLMRGGLRSCSITRKLADGLWFLQDVATYMY